jgi:hypothetical protein
MAHTIQRLTLYALISALERDLRDFLALHVAPIVQPKSLLSIPVTAKAMERFAKENSESSPGANELLEYLDLGEEVQAIRSHDNELDPVTCENLSTAEVCINHSRRRLVAVSFPFPETHSRQLRTTRMRRRGQVSWCSVKLGKEVIPWGSALRPRRQFSRRRLCARRFGDSMARREQPCGLGALP